MKFVNLFDGYNEVEDFRILICASDIEEAKAFADEYLVDACLEGNFSISETENVDSTHYDCDYVISSDSVERSRPTRNEERLVCNCEECDDKACIHRYCYRRLPRVDGGLGLCPKLKKMLEEVYPKGTRIKLISMYGEPQMPQGLLGTVDNVDDALQIHVRWDNGSSLAIVPEKDLFEKLVEKEKIIVPVFGGNIVAERNPEPSYDGISVYFEEKNGVITDLAIVEAKSELDREQIDMYLYEDIYTDSFTKKTTYKVKDILKRTSEENHSNVLNKWLRTCLDSSYAASEILATDEAQNELTEEERESLLDIIGDHVFAY